MLKIYDKFSPRANPPDANYTNGSIKNESVPGAKDGTPLDAGWANDYVGADAALLAEAGIIPSGSPDTALVSQRLEAIKTVAGRVSSRPNMLQNSHFYQPTPDAGVTPPPVGGKTYPTGTNVFLGWFVTSGGITDLSRDPNTGLIDSTSGSIYQDVPKTGSLTTYTGPLVSSWGDNAGNPTEDSDTSIVDMGDYYRVTLTPNGCVSAKLEQGVVASRHDADNNNVVKVKGKISFVFDDGFASVLTVVKTLFDARGYKCAAAINVGSIGNPGRMVINDIPKVQAAGFELINHNVTGDVANASTYGQARIRAEVQTCHSELMYVGCQPIGFQAPSSVLADEYLDEVSRVCPMAFTVGASNEPLEFGVNPLRLHRFSIEGNTQQDCIDAVTALFETGGTIVFYAHDIVTSDVNYNKIVAIMDAAESASVDVVSVSESVKYVADVPQNKQPYIIGDLIANNPHGFSASGSSTITVSNVSDIRVTALAVQQTLVQETYELPGSITPGEMITFSAALRSVSGTFSSNNSIGIQLKDVSDNILYSDEISGASLSTAYPRMNISASMVAGAVKVLVYLRIDATSVGAEALVRNPVLRFGNSVNAQLYVPVVVNNTMSSTAALVPVQTLTADVANTVTLTDESDNGRFVISGSTITMTEDWDGTLSVSLSGVEQATSGGYLAWSLSGGQGGVISISPLNTNNGTSYGSSIIAGMFYRGSSFTITCQPYDVDFNVSNNLSRITSLGRA